MRPLDFVWNWDDPDGNVAHIASHGVSPDDVKDVLLDLDAETISRETGSPVAFGFTRTGRYICVVYEWVDDVTVYPITAYEVEG
jgi:hypothetical protein